jgi:lysozyme
MLLPGDLLCLDMEDERYSGDAGAWSLDWLRYVRDVVGYNPAIYTGPWYISQGHLDKHQELAEFPLHIAAYQSSPPVVPAPWREYVAWQYSASGRVPGVSGNVDTDIFYGSLAEFRALSNAAPPIAPPAHDALADANTVIGYLTHDVADALQAAIDAAQAATNTLKRGGASV